MGFGVLGPVTAWRVVELALKGPRHRAVLARLIVARGRVVPVDSLVADLGRSRPTGRPARSAPSSPPSDERSNQIAHHARPPGSWSPKAPGTPCGPTDGRRLAVRASDDRRLRRSGSWSEALSWWRGPAYAEFADAPWAHAERSRLTELRLTAVERQAEAQLALGLAAAQYRRWTRM